MTRDVIITDDQLAAVTPADFAAATGWDPKPEGLCRGEVCVPAPGARRDDGTVDVLAAASRLGMPVVRDVGHAGNWLDDVQASGGGQHYIIRPEL